MEFWNTFVALLGRRMESLGVSAADVPVPLVIAALLFPVLLTALARQPLAFFSVLLVICGLLAVDPATAQAGALVAAGAYVASILIGVIAIQWTIRNRRIGAELARLRASVEQLHRIVEQQAAATAEVQAQTQAGYRPYSPAAAAAMVAAPAAVTAAPAIIEAEAEPVAPVPPAPQPAAEPLEPFEPAPIPPDAERELGPGSAPVESPAAEPEILPPVDKRPPDRT